MAGLLLVVGVGWVVLKGRGKGVVEGVVRDGFKGDEEGLVQGCEGRDCIGAIDEPKFERVSEASRWLKDEELVLGLDYQGGHRAYPVRILNWHEIVNDEVGDVPVVVTWSALCGRAAAFERPPGLSFGVSGLVKTSCLVMYDREGENLWGQTSGQDLTQIAVQVLTWGEWKVAHPTTMVLSEDTGDKRDYTVYPYGDYEQNEEIRFPVAEVSEEVHPKTVVYGIVINGQAKAYTLEAIKWETADDSVLNDSLGGQRVRLSYSRGEVLVENLSQREKVVATRMFWFAWKAFYPETELYNVSGRG